MLTASTSRTTEEGKPSVAELLSRAQDIGRRARECARETELNRRVSADLIRDMREADLFRILQPARFGGFEYGYDTFVKATVAVGAGDGSTGWVYSLGAVHQWLIGCFPPQAQHDVWDDDPHAISAVSYAPTGSADRVAGGYRISGRWSFASGVDNVQWVIIAGMLQKPDGQKAPGFFLVPQDDYTIDDDWFAMGLAGTGSKTVVADGAFVPEHRTAFFSDLLTGESPGSSYNTHPLFRQPFLAVVPNCLVAPQIGMARGALQVFIDQVRDRKTRGAVAGGNNSMAEFATVQMRVAEAAACVDAAETVIHRDLAETEAIAVRGEAFGVDLRIRNRRSHSFASKLSVQGVDALFAAAGGTSLGTRHPLQRFWRDIHAAATHISVNWDVVGSMYGQFVFGLEPKGQY